jgi:hypothetical protein
MKTLLAVNTLTSVNVQAYASHLNLFYRMGKDSSDECMLYNGYRQSIDFFRNNAAKVALQHECDYLMFIDDDVLIPPNTYELLKARDLDVVTPVVYIRGYPFEPMFFQAHSEDGYSRLGFYRNWKDHIREDGLVPCAAVGFSCALIKCSLLKRIPPPWFVTGVAHTEDVYFCVKCRQMLNNQVNICVDTKLHAGHLLDPEFIHTETRDALRTFYETTVPEFLTERSDVRVQSVIENNIKELEDVPSLNDEFLLDLRNGKSKIVSVSE